MRKTSLSLRCTGPTIYYKRRERNTPTKQSIQFDSLFPIADNNFTVHLAPRFSNNDEAKPKRKCPESINERRITKAIVFISTCKADFPWQSIELQTLLPLT